MSNDFIKRVGHNLNFLMAFIIILIVIYFTPAIDADSNTYNVIYKQINFSTHHFEFYKLFLYLLSVSLGFILINQMATGVEIVKRYFFGFGSAIGDFFITIGYCLIIFFFSGNTLIAGKYDYEGFCDERGLSIINSHRKDGDIGNFIFEVMSDVKRLYSFKFLENFFNFFRFTDSNANNICVLPAFFEITILNYLFYLLPFLIGLNFSTITDNFQTIKYLKMNWNKRKNWEKKHWAIYISLIVYFLLNILFLFVNYGRDSLWKFAFFFILFSLISAYITYRYIVNKNKKFLDIFNPTLIMLILLFVNIHCVYNLALFGFLTGLMTSGAGQNGIRDIFKDMDLDNYKTFSFVPCHVEMEKKEVEQLDK